MARPASTAGTQRSFSAGSPASRIGTVPKAWSANTASASGEALASASRTRHAARRSDRKSTRLNSSHGYISYAVFCLKKKNSREFLLRRYEQAALSEGLLYRPAAFAV